METEEIEETPPSIINRRNHLLGWGMIDLSIIKRIQVLGEKHDLALCKMSQESKGSGNNVS